nr:hypothetical protein BDOA9_0117030 [Bradyrhizobium sp. DOA9]
MAQPGGAQRAKRVRRSLLAKTDWFSKLKTHLSPLAAHHARVFCLLLTPLHRKGRREDRAPAGTRGPLCANCAKTDAQRHTGQPGASRPSLRSGLTAYGALSPGSDALLPPSSCR